MSGWRILLWNLQMAPRLEGRLGTCTKILRQSWEIGVEKKKKSVQEIHCCHSGMYNQLHRGKQQKRGGWGWKGGNKKSSEKLKIELYWCQSCRKRATGYGGSQEQHGHANVVLLWKIQILYRQMIFLLCSALTSPQMSMSLVFGSTSRTFLNSWRNCREV